MSVNSSSSSDSTFLHPNLSSINAHIPVDLECLMSEPGSLIFTTFSITNLFLLLPLCIFILYHGFQEWRKKCSPSTISHSDSFTYHLVIMELVGISGNILSCCGIYKKNLNMLEVGDTLFTLTWYGENYFQTLTCVEHYLAVVHPITYVSLKNQRGIRIRNISIGCIWLFCFIGIGWVTNNNAFLFLDFCHLILLLMVVSFCSLSVLCGLIHSGPRKHGGGFDQSKQKVFYTIVVILGLLVLRFCWGLVWAVQFISRENVNCVTLGCEAWFNLPSSLVLPLLFLHRNGKFVSCISNNH